MKRKATLFILVCTALLPVALPAASPLRGTVIQGDDFSTNATLIEKWDKKNNVEIKDGKLYLNQGTLAPRHELPEEYYMAFDVVALDDAKNFPNGGGFLTISADDVLALIRPGGGHQLLMPNPDNPQKRIGGGKTLKPVPGQPLRVELSRQKGTEGLYRYTLIINDQVIHQLSCKAKAKPAVSFGQWRAEAVLDNVEFCTIKQGQTSPNLVINSSLEHLQENFNPQYFTLGLNRDFKSNPSFEDFAPCLNPDDKVAHSGKRSFRLQNKAPLATGALVGTADIGVIKGQPATFSVYLKASKSDTPARLTIRGMWGRQFHKDVKVGTEWQRYSITESPENSLIRCNVSNAAKDDAILWADDFQCELGATLTEYAPCVLDDVKLGLKKLEYAPIPPIKPVKFATAPVLDGKLENLWQSGVKVDSFTVLKPDSRPTPKHKTEAFFGYDKDNLYIGVRAYVGDLAKVKAAEMQRDNTNIVNGNDCIEIYIDRGPTRKEMFWLAANSLGSQLDAAPGDRLNWNGNWRVAASQNKELNALEYEFAIPFSELSGTNLSETFGINIGRTAPADGESSDITTTPRRMFKVAEVFPQMILPREAIRPYSLGIRSAALSNAIDRKDGVNLELIFVNNTGDKKELLFNVNDAKDGAKLASFDASIPSGETVLSVPVSLAAPAATRAVVIEGSEKGRVILSAFERAAVVNAVTVLPRFDYYMNEPAAEVLVEMKLPSPDGVKAVLSCGKFSKTIPVAKRQFVSVPLAGLPDGKNSVQLKLTGKNLDYSVSAPLVKKPFFKGATQIDRIRLCVFNDGKPVLPVAPLICINQKWRQDVEKFIPEIRFQQKYGFNEFIILLEGEDDFVAESAKKLNDLGIKFILWTKALTKGVEHKNGTWFRTDYDPKPLMEKLNLPGVIAIMPWDEPEISGLKSEDCAWTMEKVNAAKMYQPTAINYTVIGIPARYANLDADIIGIDDYVTNNDKRDAESVLAYVRRVMDTCRAERKVGYFFTAGEVYGNHYRCPTYQEQIALNYGSLVAGITGLEFFYALPINPGNWRGMVQIAREFAILTPVVCSAEEAAEAQISDSAVKFTTRRLNGKFYVIAVNTENRPAKGVGITLPAGLKFGPKVEVLFDNRSIRQADGRFQDDFEPYSRRVYSVNID